MADTSLPNPPVPKSWRILDAIQKKKKRARLRQGCRERKQLAELYIRGDQDYFGCNIAFDLEVKFGTILWGNDVGVVHRNSTMTIRYSSTVRNIYENIPVLVEITKCSCSGVKDKYCKSSVPCEYFFSLFVLVT